MEYAGTWSQLLNNAIVCARYKPTLILEEPYVGQIRGNIVVLLTNYLLPS
jgi:hypothetical protein